MQQYEDAGHRPHADFKGERPTNNVTPGPYALQVTLDTWGPRDHLFTTIYDQLQSNWGNLPMRSAKQLCWDTKLEHERSWEHQTGWCQLKPGQQHYVRSCFEGKTLNQVLELITFAFTVDNVSRASTHQLVRTRIGAGFMQHGGRDNDWRHRAWTLPETIRRAVAADRERNYRDRPDAIDGLSHCVTDWSAIDRYLIDEALVGDGLGGALRDYLDRGRRLYSAMVDAGIPWQDARRVLWMGTQTYIHIDYNYLALSGVTAKRGEHIMDWEINAVNQLMVREVRMKCPPLIGESLVSASDKAQVAKFAGLESWPPDGKYPNPYEKCEVCGFGKDDPHTGHNYAPKDTLPRTHRPEQNPYWVLSPISMAGGPVLWIPTNGVYPHDVVAQHRETLDRERGNVHRAYQQVVDNGGKATEEASWRW